MFNRLRAEARRLIREAVEMAWFMRGSLQYHSIMDMTPMERDVVKDFIKEHMENVKDHSFPVY